MAELARWATGSLTVGACVDADGAALGDAVRTVADVEALAVLEQHAVKKTAREDARPPDRLTWLRSWSRWERHGGRLADLVGSLGKLAADLGECMSECPRMGRAAAAHRSPCRRSSAPSLARSVPGCRPVAPQCGGHLLSLGHRHGPPGASRESRRRGTARRGARRELSLSFPRPFIERRPKTTDRKRQRRMKRGQYQPFERRISYMPGIEVTTTRVESPTLREAWRAGGDHGGSRDTAVRGLRHAPRSRPRKRSLRSLCASADSP